MASCGSATDAVTSNTAIIAITLSAGKEKSSSNSRIQDDSNSVHHEQMRDASKSDVSPNTPPGDDKL